MASTKRYAPGEDKMEEAMRAYFANLDYSEPSGPTAPYDKAMERHLRAEREARGYTTREPDAYRDSSNARWKQDAEDWVAHRDAVMSYALAVMNEVEAGTREPPTLEEFTAGLPRIVWTYPDA